MTLNTTMFASHTVNSDTKISNSMAYRRQKQVFDIGGSESMPFLRHILSSDVAKLTAPGMGFQCNLNAQNLDFDAKLDVYYFSEVAFRIIVDTAQPDLFYSWLCQFEESFDIDVINRTDLRVMLVSGEDAFETLVHQFKFTPGIRLSDNAQRFGAQSGSVFVTSVCTGVYELLANNSELENWQEQFTKLGFTIN